jgi:hypothetical protein
LAGDVWRLYTRPGELFVELPQRNRFGLVLVLLVFVQFLYGVAVISTGVPEYETNRRVQQARQRYLRRVAEDEGPEKQAKTLEDFDKEAVFLRQWKRVMLLAVAPIGLLAWVGLLAGILFLMVALRGGKPSFGVLAGVVTFAALVEVPRLLVRLWLTAQLHAGRVETSAAAFAGGPQVGLGGYILLRRLDPFDAWFWCLIGLGLARTGQLPGRRAVTATLVLAVLVMLVQSAADVLDLANLNS